MSYDVSDCIAMSEDGDWFAFPKEMGRAQVMAAIARNGEYMSGCCWRETLEAFSVRAGYVHKEVGKPGYWHEVTDGVICHLCVPCWIVRRR